MLWGRIFTIKMNVLSKMMFSFQMIPVIEESGYFKSWQKDLSKFIWQYRKMRIKHKLLIDSKDRGGLELPDLKLYYKSACLSLLKDWMTLQNSDLLDLEGFDNPFGWHVYLGHKKVKIHRGFLNHVIRKPLYKAWGEI